MIREIKQMIRDTRVYTGVGSLSPAVETSMRDTPRDEFVEPDQKSAAYVNSPLPIGFGQTISQPFIVALMTELLAPTKDDRILEIGTGSGYQAAVLASIVAEVCTVEIVEPLARRAERQLEALGYDNVQVRLGDGRRGWPEAAPFDGIIVTAVADELPRTLVDQLKPGGRMVIPIGPRHGAQDLILVEKLGDGSIRRHETLPVQFVELTGEGN